MHLDLATFLSLAGACAPGVPPPTLLAIARVESGLDPLAIGVNGPDAARVGASTSREAVRRAMALIASGRDIDLGLAQINVRNLPRLGLTVADAFDPCRNLAASARLLTEAYQRALPSRGEGQPALYAALSAYNTGDPDRGVRNGYVGRVLAQISPAPASAPQRGAARTSAPAAWDAFAQARLAPRALVFKQANGAAP
jgi:type IV secretion system protein VirB1